MFVTTPTAYKQTLNHTVYLKMCVMQKMPFTAWTESGCVADRLKSSLPRVTAKVSAGLSCLSECCQQGDVVNVGLHWCGTLRLTILCSNMTFHFTSVGALLPCFVKILEKSSGLNNSSSDGETALLR